jgi:hypothetical protein
MHLCEIHETQTQNQLLHARTGHPFKIIGYRGQYKSQTDPSRGVFYYANYESAKGYTTSGGSTTNFGRNKSRVITKQLIFNNPLVVRGTSEVLDYLVEHGVLDAKLAERLQKHGV